MSDQVKDGLAIDVAGSPHQSPPAVFLDRDGVLNAVPGLGWSPRRAGELSLLPGVGEALRRLRDNGWLLVVVSNQPGIAKGQMSEADHLAIVCQLEAELSREGVALAGAYYCLHHPDPGQVIDRRYLTACECRKPAPGLLRAAATDLGLHLPAAWMVGDSWRDVEAGAAAGCRTIAVGTFEQWREPRHVVPDATVRDLTEAVDFILSPPH